MAFDFLLILFMLFSPFVFLVYGERAASLLSKISGLGQPLSRDREFDCPVLFVFGLLVYLYIVLLLKLASLPWWAATFIPLLPVFFHLESLRDLFSKVSVRIGLNFGLWFFVILGLGVSLFNTHNGISTAWTNNYGDLTFHLGMISSFVFGDNIPAEYHLYAGEALSYPYLINLWSSLYWWIGPEWETLSLVFLFQWTLLWSLVFILLNGNRYPMIPWALLLGGGSYFIFGAGCEGAELCVAFGKNSGQMISQNVPWTVFLTTIWVTQRTALFGVVTSLVALSLFHRRTQEHGSFYMLLCALILSASFLVHTHITLCVGAYIGCSLLLKWIASKNGEFERRELVWFIVGLLPSFLNLFWLLGKAGTTKFIFGWSTGGESLKGVAGLVKAAKVWLQGPVLLLLPIALFWGMSKQHIGMFVLTLLFVCANIIQLAVWDWDQLKVFLALYITFLALWSATMRKDLWWMHFVLVLGMVPAISECLILLGSGQNYTIYPKENVDRARIIRDLTSADDIIAVAPDHNSLGTLMGRRIFYGYEGTLNSHGLKYKERQRVQRNLKLLAKCRESYTEAPEVCPSLLVWTDAEKRYWKGAHPQGYFSSTKHGFIWKLKDNGENK